MNAKALVLLACLLSHPLTYPISKPLDHKGHIGIIPLSDLVIHIDEDDIRIESKKSEPSNPYLRMTYIISTGVVLTAAIVAGVILTIHFNQ